MAKPSRRLTSIRRLERVRTLLVTDGLTLAELADRAGVSERTVQRYLAELIDRGLPISEEFEGRRKVFRLLSTVRPSPSLGPQDLVALELARRSMAAFRGTGLWESMDRIAADLNAHVDRRGVLDLESYRSKLVFIEQGNYDYENREDDFDALLSGLLRERRLEVRHVAVDLGETTFRIDPYSLLIYRNGVYVVGFSDHHDAIRTFGFDGFCSISWLRRDRFSRPPDFDPHRMLAGSFGLMVGTTTKVRVRFDRSVARYVRRRRWHPSQRFTEGSDGLYMELVVDGITEIESWLLSFGSRATVIEPEVLRRRLCAEHLKAAELDGGSRVSLDSSRRGAPGAGACSTTTQPDVSTGTDPRNNP